MTTITQHKPVLLDEVIEHLSIRPDDVVLDGTVGGGGHAEAMCGELGESGVFIGIDQDSDALSRTKDRLSACSCKVHLEEGNFRNLDIVLDKLGVPEIDKALFDLGWSSDQISDPERGFSFQFDSPLTMTLKKNPEPSDITAFDVVNDWEESTIADVLFAFGGERYSRRIAKNIVSARTDEPIKTTVDLVEIIKKSVPAPYRNGRLHPATRTFQAIRIVVNDEYGALREMLEKIIDRIKPGGRIAVITFHSGEDTIVKHFFKQQAAEGLITLLNKKVIVPAREEQKENPRSRSAKLRVIEKNN